jgi:hypothetical protein
MGNQSTKDDSMNDDSYESDDTMSIGSEISFRPIRKFKDIPQRDLQSLRSVIQIQTEFRNLSLSNSEVVCMYERPQDIPVISQEKGKNLYIQRPCYFYSGNGELTTFYSEELRDSIAKEMKQIRKKRLISQLNREFASHS